MKKNRQKLPVFGLSILAIAAIGAFALSAGTTHVIPILMYHSIDHSDKTSKLSVSPESFARQMEFLNRRRYNVISLEKAVSYIKTKEIPPSKTLAITFDDGSRIITNTRILF